MLPALARTGSNYRAYSTAHVERLHFIRRCRGLDMSLAEVRLLLVFCDEPQRHCKDVNAMLDERIRHVDQRIEELTRLSRELKQLRGVCRAPGTAGNCRILTTLRSSAAPARVATADAAGARWTRVRGFAASAASKSGCDRLLFACHRPIGDSEIPRAQVH